MCSPLNTSMNWAAKPARRAQTEPSSYSKTTGMSEEGPGYDTQASGEPGPSLGGLRRGHLSLDDGELGPDVAHCRRVVGGVVASQTGCK